MEQKTKINAEEGRQELVITREFDLPVALLFKAYTDADIVEQWMGTSVLKLDNKRHGSYQFETTDPRGNKYGFHGVIHEFSPNQKITRTFEMESMSASGGQFGPQLEFLEFEKLTDHTSKLTMHIVYRSVAHRHQMMQLGMPSGINRAHNRLQAIVGSLN